MNITGRVDINFRSVVGTDTSEHVTESGGELLGVGEVNALVGGVGVSLGSNETESKDLSLGVHLSELGKEGDGATHTVGAGVFTVPEGFSSIGKDFLNPRLGLGHAPALAGVASVESDLAVVRHVLGEFLSDSIGGLLGVHVGWESHGDTHAGGGADNVSGLGDFGKTVGTSDGKVGRPGVVQVHLDKVVLVDHLDTLVNIVFSVHAGSAQVSHSLGFLFGPLGNLSSECLEGLASLGVIESVEELTHNAESLGDDATDFSGMVATLGGLDGQIDDGDSSEGGSNPELFVVEGTGVHAEAEVGNSNEFLSSGEEGNEVGATRLLFGLEDESDTGNGHALFLGVLDGEHGRERRVSVIGTTTTVEVLSANDRDSGSKALVPAFHPWLLVEMTVEHDVLVAATGGLNNVDDEGSHAFGLESLLGQALNVKLVDIVVNELGAVLDKSVGQECVVDHGGEVGASDEVRETGNVPVFPVLVNELVSGFLVDFVGFNHLVYFFLVCLRYN